MTKYKKAEGRETDEAAPFTKVTLLINRETFDKTQALEMEARSAKGLDPVPDDGVMHTQLTNAVVNALVKGIGDFPDVVLDQIGSIGFVAMMAEHLTEEAAQEAHAELHADAEALADAEARALAESIPSKPNAKSPWKH